MTDLWRKMHCVQRQNTESVQKAFLELYQHVYCLPFALLILLPNEGKFSRGRRQKWLLRTFQRAGRNLLQLNCVGTFWVCMDRQLQFRNRNTQRRCDVKLHIFMIPCFAGRCQFSQCGGASSGGCNGTHRGMTVRAGRRA